MDGKKKGPACLENQNLRIILEIQNIFIGKWKLFFHIQFEVYMVQLP